MNINKDIFDVDFKDHFCIILRLLKIIWSQI